MAWIRGQKNAWSYYEDDFSSFCYDVGHWIFSIQYLKISINLPHLFNTVKLERFQQEAEDDIANDTKRKLDLSKLE